MGNEEELDKWYNLHYRMDAEGFEYCFKHYSEFEEIKDPKFHKLRKEVISKIDDMNSYVENRIAELEEEQL